VDVTVLLAFFFRGEGVFDPRAMSAKSRYLLKQAAPAGSKVLAFDALAGRGAIQTSSGEATGLRGFGFLGMLITTLQISTYPRMSMRHFNM